MLVIEMDMDVTLSQDEVDITFFVPCLNEEKNVTGALRTIVESAAETGVTYEILVVDDASTDNTVGVVEEFQREHPGVRIQLKKNERNRGLGRNYADGSYISYGRHYMLVNGDNVEQKVTLVALLSHLGEADILIPYFGDRDNRPFRRRIVSRAFTKLVNIISGNHIGYYNGPVVHHRLNVIRWHPDTHGFAYQAMLITRLLDEGATYLEFEVPNEDRPFGATKAFRLRNFLSIGHSLLEIGLRRLRRALFFGHQ